MMDVQPLRATPTVGDAVVFYIVEGGNSSRRAPPALGRRRLGKLQIKGIGGNLRLKSYMSGQKIHMTTGDAARLPMVLYMRPKSERSDLLKASWQWLPLIGCFEARIAGVARSGREYSVGCDSLPILSRTKVRLHIVRSR